MDSSKLLRASNDGKVKWNTTRCILPVAYRRICNGNPGLWLAVFFKAWDKSWHTCLPSLPYIHIHGCTYLPIYTCMFLSTYIYMDVPIYLHIHGCTYLSTYTWMYLSTYIYMDVPIYLHIHGCTYLPTYRHTYLTFYVSTYRESTYLSGDQLPTYINTYQVT